MTIIEKVPAGQRPRLNLGQAMAHLVLIPLAALTLFPIYWMLVTAVRPAEEVFGPVFQLLPSAVSVDNFAKTLGQTPLLRFMLNGVVICAASVIMQLLTSIPCAYALAKYDFRGRNLLFALVIFALCVPIQVTAIPLYIAIALSGMLDTYFAILVPHVVSAFCIFLLRQSFKAFPEEIIQAARLDGLSEWSILWGIVVPNV